jgi:hypothetical protein
MAVAAILLIAAGLLAWQKLGGPAVAQATGSAQPTKSDDPPDKDNEKKDKGTDGNGDNGKKVGYRGQCAERFHICRLRSQIRHRSW